MVKSYKVNLNKDILSISFDYVTEWLNQVQFNFLHFDQSPTPQTSNETDGCDALLIMMAPVMVILLDKKKVFSLS
jgi:hypothetical protein